MASLPPLKDNAPLTGRGTDPRGLTLADLARMTPHEQMMASLAITGEDAKLAEQGPMLRPAQEVSDPWGLRLRDLAFAQKEGAGRALQNIPISPLAGVVALSPAYEKLTAEVPGANPEAPNVLAAVDNLSLGGLIEGPVAQGLLRAGEMPSMRGPGARRRKGTPAPGPLEAVEQTVAGETPILRRGTMEAPAGGGLEARAAAGAAQEGDALTLGQMMTGAKRPRIEGLAPVEGSGRAGQVTVEDVAKHLNANTLLRLGQVTGEDPVAVLNRALEQGSKDMEYQMGTGRTGHDWYKEDVQKLDREMATVFPEIDGSTSHKTLFKTVVALLSPNTRPNDNLMRASRLWDVWRERGYDPANLPVKKPTELVKEGQAGQWGRGSEYALTKLQRLLTQEGSIEKAVEWLQAEHPVRELRKEGWGDLGHLGVNDNATGFEVFGPKVGQFVQNLEGNAKKLTVDKWFMRTWGRYMGTLVDSNGLLRETPLESQRPIMEEMADRVGKQYNMDPADVQATLWYYEQQLYNELGAKVKEVSFGESAEAVRREIERARSERGRPTGSGEAIAGRGETAPGEGPRGLPAAATARGRRKAQQEAGLTLGALMGEDSVALARLPTIEPQVVKERKASPITDSGILFRGVGPSSPEAHAGTALVKTDSGLVSVDIYVDPAGGLYTAVAASPGELDANSLREIKARVATAANEAIGKQKLPKRKAGRAAALREIFEDSLRIQTK